MPGASPAADSSPAISLHHHKWGAGIALLPWKHSHIETDTTLFPISLLCSLPRPIHRAHIFIITRNIGNCSNKRNRYYGGGIRMAPTNSAIRPKQLRTNKNASPNAGVSANLLTHPALSSHFIYKLFIDLFRHLCLRHLTCTRVQKRNRSRR
jgi:hypothetical protein